MIPVSRPWTGEEEAEAARRPLLSGWVMQGPEVAAFENEFASYVNAPHACAVSSGTAALHLALLAAGVRPGDEVVTVSHSFIATANSIRYCGAIPVFVDIDPRTLNIDPALVEHAITPHTRAILCVHQIGMPCDLAAILLLARARGLTVIEDAACATGSEILWEGAWERIGKPHGDIACFSFHPRKIITTGDGGMITTARPEWDRRFRLLRQHAMSVPHTVRHTSSQVVAENYVSVGFNYRMTDIQAAVGRVQLKRLPEIIRRRRRQADRYATLLATLPVVTPPFEPLGVRTNWQSYAISLPPNCSQQRVMQFMLDRGISTRRGIMCAHREPAYRNEPWSCAGGGHSGAPPIPCPQLLHSEQAQDRMILLPLFHELTEEQQVRVVETLRLALLAETDV
jgi:dTDP-4-amino-4,6-dideoxygalactose transaminase